MPYYGVCGSTLVIHYLSRAQGATPNTLEFGGPALFLKVIMLHL